MLSQAVEVDLDDFYPPCSIRQPDLQLHLYRPLAPSACHLHPLSLSLSLSLSVLVTIPALCLSATAVVDDLESTRAKQGRVNEGAPIRETNEQYIVYWVDTIHD